MASRSSWTGRVPVTRRHVNESFWVLTGTTRSGTLSEDIRLAVQSTATVIILMGVRKLPEIAALYNRAGRGDLPSMVIQNGSLPEERVVTGAIRELPEIARKEGIGTPGIILIGEAVGLHRNFSTLVPKALVKSIATAGNPVAPVIK